MQQLVAGGVLFASHESNISVNTSNFHNNEAGHFGGALCVWRSSSITVYNSRFDSNTAGRLNTHLVSSWEEVCNGDTTTAATGVPVHEGDGEGEKKETQSVHITSGKTHYF